MKRTLFLLFFAVFLSVCNSAFAQIFLEDGKVVLSVKPDEKIAKTVTVHNTSNQPIKLRAYWEDFLYEPPFDGSKKFLPAATTLFSLARWASFIPKEFELPPFGKQKVEYVIGVPHNIKGGHYGVLFFENLSSQTANNETGVNIVTRVGCLFFLEPEDKSKKAVIGDLSFTASSLEGLFKNEGDVILIPQGTFYIMDSQGVAVDRGELKKLYLPPGERGKFGLDLKKNFPKGRYTVVLTFDVQEGGVLVKEIDFQKTATDIRIIAVRD